MLHVASAELYLSETFMLNWLKENLKDIALVVVPLIVAWMGFEQHLDSQRQVLDFEKYKAITEAYKQLGVETNSVHQQVFFVYELRNHPEYYAVTLRILKNVLAKDNQKNVFTEEIQLTIEYIESKI